MAGETVLTVVGNLVDDPELRFTPSGAAVANFRIASTPRVYDKQSSEWKDGDTLWLTCSIWKQAAENVGESLSKGMRVIVQGRLKSRQYEKDGQKHTVFEIDVEEVGPSLKSATAKVAKAAREKAYDPGYTDQRKPTQPQGDPWSAAPANDPWGVPGAGQEPPF
jgi:single-strand DNA-binding protein